MSILARKMMVSPSGAGLQEATHLYYGLPENGSGGFYIVDITDPTAMSVVGTLVHSNLRYINDVVVDVDRGIAFTASRTLDISAINDADPTNPVYLSYFNGEGQTDAAVALSLDVERQILYSCSRSSSWGQWVAAMDVSDPSNITMLGSYQIYTSGRGGYKSLLDKTNNVLWFSGQGIYLNRINLNAAGIPVSATSYTIGPYITGFGFGADPSLGLTLHDVRNSGTDYNSIRSLTIPGISPNGNLTNFRDSFDADFLHGENIAVTAATYDYTVRVLDVPSGAAPTRRASYYLGHGKFVDRVVVDQKAERVLSTNSHGELLAFTLNSARHISLAGTLALTPSYVRPQGFALNTRGVSSTNTWDGKK